MYSGFIRMPGKNFPFGKNKVNSVFLDSREEWTVSISHERQGSMSKMFLFPGIYLLIKSPPTAVRRRHDRITNILRKKRVNINCARVNSTGE